MRLRHVPSFLALVLLLGIGVGCSDEGSGDSAPSPSPAQSVDSSGALSSSVVEPDGVSELSSGSPATVNSKSVESPDQLRPYGPEGDRLLWNVREDLTRRCMADAGFEYLTNDVPDAPIPDPIPRLSIQAAQTDGYRQLLSAGEDPELRVSRDATLPGFAEALDPSEDGNIGCFEYAYVEIFNEDHGQTALDLFRSLEGLDITSVVEVSPEFGELVSEWSTCMATDGFAYANLGEAVFQFVGPAAGSLDSPPSPDEIRVAVADARCRETIKFEDRYGDLYSAHYAAWRTENEAALQEVSRQVTRDLEQVRTVADRLGVSD
jgi:hypothetical protein